jgi:RNA-binding protein 39
LLTKPASKSESRAAPPVQPIETACFQLSNMFDPSKEKGDSWHEDIRSDVIAELTSYGGAVHVYVDKHSKDGVVYVKAYTRDSAMLATKSMHGKYFDGKMIQAAYIPEVNYLELFPAAANQKTALNLDSA